MSFVVVSMLDINKYSGVIKIEDIENHVLQRIMLRNGTQCPENKGGFYFCTSDKAVMGNEQLYEDLNPYSDYSDYNER